MNRTRRRLALLPAFVFAAALLSMASVPAWAQLPPSPPKRTPGGEGPSVIYAHPDRGPIVCRLLAEAKDEALVLAGDNQMFIPRTREISPTSRPFEMFDQKGMIDSLKAEFPGFNVRNTKRFVYVYNTTEIFYTGTSRILETMYSPLFDYFKRMKIPLHDPDTLLVIIMFATDKEFQQYRQMPQGVVAYYNMLDNRVAMYEQSALSRVAPAIARKEAISTVAHEGVHQILGNIGVQQRLSPWPIWISEGLAEYFAPTDVTSEVRWKGVGKVNEFRLVSLNRVVSAAAGEADLVMRGINGGGGAAARVGAGKGLGKPENEVDKVIEALAGAEGLSATGYACTWGLTHYLAESKKKEFQAFLVEASELKPLTRLTTDERVELFRRHFGDDIEPLGRGLTDHAKRLKTRKN